MEIGGKRVFEGELELLVILEFECFGILYKWLYVFFGKCSFGLVNGWKKGILFSSVSPSDASNGAPWTLQKLFVISLKTPVANVFSLSNPPTSKSNHTYS